MKAGEAITHLLAAYGVKHVFGIPGTHTLELYRGLAKDCGIRHVLAHHEQGAGFMADGYARITNRPGVCYVITGAGVTNISTPLGEAYADSVPLLVISPVNPVDGGGYNQGRLHEITDQAAVTAPLTAFSATAQSIEEIPELIGRAFAVFATERPRPIHISVPLPLLGQDITTRWEPFDLPKMPRVPTDELEHAKDYIETARQPIMVVGGGTRFCSKLVVELAETLGCPVITTVAGRGVIPASHPLCAGAQLRALPVQTMLGEADLAIFLGTELAQTDHWSDDLPIPPRQIRINIDSPSLLAAGDVIAMRGDVADATGRLCKLVSIERKKARTQVSARRCLRLRSDLASTMTAKERRHWQVLQALRISLPDNAQVFSDMTQLSYTAIDFLALERPNSWHHPIGFGTLGYALPAAIGGAIADPSRPTVVIVGDAGLQYTMQELPLAVELGLNIKIVLWNNDTLAQIKDDMVAADIPPTGVRQKNPDFGLLAQACGWEYGSVDKLEDLEQRLAHTFTQAGPYLLQVNEHRLFPNL